MPPRKKTAVKKRKTTAKKTTRRAKHRETPLEKLAFRVSILEEGFDTLEEDLRDLRRAHDAIHAAPEAIEVSILDIEPEPAKTIGESSPHTEPVLSDDEL
jgi:hypothetical protein